MKRPLLLGRDTRDMSAANGHGGASDTHDHSAQNKHDCVWRENVDHIAEDLKTTAGIKDGAHGEVV